MAYEGDELLDSVTSKEYEFGFTTNIESDKAPAGLNEDIIRLISAKKNEPEWLLQWRLESFAIWQKMMVSLALLTITSLAQRMKWGLFQKT